MTKVRAAYVVGNKEHKFYKIGMSGDVHRRVQTLNNQVPFLLELIAIYPHRGCNKLERHLHAIYAEKRGKGEWFTLTDEEVALLPAHVEQFNQQFPPNSPEIHTVSGHECSWCKKART